MKRHRILAELDSLIGLSAAELSKKTDLLTAVHLIAQAWENVTSKTNQNCFAKGGFKEVTDESYNDDPTPLPEDMSLKISKLG